MRADTSIFFIMGLVAAVGCGPAPYLYEPEAAGTRPSEERRVMIVPALPGSGAEVSSPFARGQVWSGTYECPQGETDVDFIIADVAGDRVRAVFDFFHAPSLAAGSYVMDGVYDPSTRMVRFSPGDWIERPPRYVTVGLVGVVRGGRFAGDITHETCGGFDMRLQEDGSD
jgi:hypothetical protein